MLTTKKSNTDVLDTLPAVDGYYVYLLLCQNGSLYCGWTTNTKRRYLQHQNKLGAKYTKANPPIGLYYYECLSSSKEARKREYQIKRLSRQEKIDLKNK